MLASGIWPVASIGTFQFVTGPKTDTWLVKTVGTLIAVVGAQTLVNAGRGERQVREGAIAASGTAAALGAISFHYARTGRISPVYFLDTLVEATWFGLWLRLLRAHQPPPLEGSTPGRPTLVCRDRSSLT